MTTGVFVAIKNIRMESEVDGIPATSIREISMLKELQHPNIVPLNEIMTHKGQLYLIFEFLSMDLKRYLDTMCDTFMELKTLKSFLYQVF